MYFKYLFKFIVCTCTCSAVCAAPLHVIAEEITSVVKFEVYNECLDSNFYEAELLDVNAATTYQIEATVHPMYNLSYMTTSEYKAAYTNNVLYNVCRLCNTNIDWAKLPRVFGII